ncbi:lipid A deacylase LpxR family protein [Rubrimonas cliftonensis]|uniref:Lipid A deacylase LpxR family protein n=1 Tax=Rubrimonas cliftonensis TaxID=89524 RepID=A0A1H3W3G1_9RHOB|nr:lipid A deacylase LpxR family protein [Rubrimonas cliftonensis]SDZ80892.1 hypothetical protein SAMN05444370_101460 [Rubrimonas cliftonensis]
MARTETRVKRSLVLGAAAFACAAPVVAPAAAPIAAPVADAVAAQAPPAGPAPSGAAAVSIAVAGEGRAPIAPEVEVEAGAGAAETAASFDAGGFYSVTFENDLFGGDDRDYTNGLRLSYTSRRNELPLWGRYVRDRLGWLTRAQDWYVAYALGQNIYTPTDIGDPSPPADERPYAGFLYLSAALIADRGDRLDTLALDVGMVGPASLAEQAQKFVHSVGPFEDPLGWDAQLGDEPAFRLLYEQKRRAAVSLDLGLLNLEADVLPHVSVAVGTVDTSAATGVTVRLGQDLGRDYGPPRIRPAVSGPAFFSPEAGFGWSLFASAEARLVGRNLFLEGNTFRDGPRVDAKRLVGDFSVGASLRFRAAELTYTQVLRTREYEGQDDPALFGSLNLSVRF